MNNENKLPVEEVFRQIFENMYGYYYEREYMETIANFPLRTVMQYLNSYKPYFRKDSIEDTDRKEFIQRNKDIFLTSLMEFGLDQEFFDIARSEKGIDLFVYKTIFKFELEDVATFLPISIDSNKNISLIIIPQFFNLYVKHYNFIEWGVKVLIPFYLKSLIPKISEKEIGLDKFSSSFLKIDNMIHLLKDKDLFVFQVYRGKEVISQEDGESTYLLEKKVFTRDNPSINFLFLTIPYVGIKEKKTQIDDYFSPLYILAFLDLLLNLKDKQGEDAEEENIKRKLKNFVVKFISYRIEYDHIVELKEEKDKGSKEEEFFEETEYEHNEIPNGEIEILINTLYEWFKILPSDKIMHLIQFNNAFFEFLRRGSQKLKPNSYLNVQEFLETSLAVFINELVSAVIVDKDFTMKQIVKHNTAMRNLRTNLGKLKEKNRNFYRNLFKFYLLSPIFMAYFSDDNKSAVLSIVESDREIIGIDTDFIEKLKNFNEKVKDLEISLKKIKIINSANRKMPKNMFLRTFRGIINCEDIDDSIKRIEDKFKESKKNKKKYKREALPSKNEMRNYISEYCHETRSHIENV
ncbi:hypothetical protein [Persephonella sp.]